MMIRFTPFLVLLGAATGDAVAQQGQIAVYDDSGQPLTVSVQKGQEVFEAPGLIAVDFDGASRIEYTLSSQGPVTPGWARVALETGQEFYFPQIGIGGDTVRLTTAVTLYRTSDVPGSDTIGGSLRFEIVDQGDRTAIAAVLPSPLRNVALLPGDPSPSVATGIGVANPAATTTFFVAELYDGESPVATASFTLPPQGHRALFVKELFPDEALTGLAEPLIQVAANARVPVVSLLQKGLPLTVVPVSDGGKKSNHPILDLRDLFKDGTLYGDPSQPGKIYPAGGGVVSFDAFGGSVLQYPVKTNGIADLSGGSLASGTYRMRIDVPGFVPVEQTILVPAIPAIIELADETRINTALLNRIWGTSWGYPGRNLKPASEQEWEFYFDTTNTFLENPLSPFRGIRDVYQQVVEDALSRTGFMAGGKPLGRNFIEAEETPADLTPYTAIVRRDDSVSAVRVGISVDSSTYDVLAMLVRYPNGATPNNVGSDLWGIFGEDQNRITSEDLEALGVSIFDSVLFSGGQTPFPTLRDDYRHRLKLVLPAGAEVRDGTIHLPDRPVP